MDPMSREQIRQYLTEAEEAVREDNKTLSVASGLLITAMFRLNSLQVEFMNEEKR